MDSFNEKEKKRKKKCKFFFFFFSSSSSCSAFHRALILQSEELAAKGSIDARCLAEEKEAFGELNYLKGRARTGAFYECRAQWRPLWAPRVAYTCCPVHARSHVRASGGLRR